MEKKNQTKNLLLLNLLRFTHRSVYITVYFYVCVCVCVSGGVGDGHVGAEAQ